MKEIKIKNKCIGSGINYIGWSGRGWPDGGAAGAGPISSRAPSWDSYGQEIGINMVRMGFSIGHFLPEQDISQHSISDQIKRGLENSEVSWAKSEKTSYCYAIQRCSDLKWKILGCVNPSYRSWWTPTSISQTSHSLSIWKVFCFHLAKTIEENWPGMADHFEITNEPDIGYFDGESYLPHYRGFSGGITPFQYSLLLEAAYEGVKRAVPGAKIIGPGLASWNRHWIKEVLSRSGAFLGGLSYHNVGGNLKDEETLAEAKSLLERDIPQASGSIFNSEWGWWPNHDIDQQETALRIAQILHSQTAGNAFGSLYLGPAQPMGFKKGLGVLRFNPQDPNSVIKTRTFFAFRLMVRGILEGKKLELTNPFKKLKILALLKNRKELVITIINPSKKRFRSVALNIDREIPLAKESFLKFYQLDYNHSDSLEIVDSKILKKFDIGAESIIQLVLSISPQRKNNFFLKPE